jgi:actin related protein 2/3 complex subunit 2
MSVPMRGKEAMYILPYSDRVMVTFSLDFEDSSDVVLGKVFLQEFYDIRQKHTVQNAPTVIFGKELPAEMAKFIPEVAKSNLNFISFGISYKQ